MNNLTRVPPEPPPFLPDDLPSLGALVRHEPRGASVDQGAAIAQRALELPALPGTGDTEKRAELRRKKIAAITANRGRVLNELGRGTIEAWLALTGLAVVAALAGPEVALVGGVLALGAAVLVGRR
jgi:hypothetical protein